MDKKNWKFATKQIHAGVEEHQFGALNIPIFASSTFKFDCCDTGGKRFAGEEDGYMYSRLGNPTVNQVERKIAALEGGAFAVGCGSGMGAITTAVWSRLKAGDHLLTQKVLYGCSFSFFEHGLKRYGVEVDYVDQTNPECFRDAIKENTKLIYLETPANPTMDLTDIKAVCDIAKEYNIEVMVDNTFMTPYIQKPLELGADFVVHSATKYLNGHGDVIAGFVVGKNPEHEEEVRMFGLKDMTGAVLSPFEAFLINRGLKTLDIRMEKHCKNAMKVAEFLENHEKIERVYYPGLKSFPQYELAQRQMTLPGAMIVCEVKGGYEAGVKFMDNLKLFTLCVSLGDCESLIEHPASMTHSTYTEEERKASNITDGLVRISIGLEDPDDLIDALKEALKNI